MELLVIADDVTGALDTGVQLTRYGTGVLVTTEGAETSDARVGSVPVWVADTNTRHRHSADARRVVAACASRALRLGTACIYKKTDSTLRGNIGAELDAVMSASGAAFLVFVPALPAAGRTTQRGVHYVNGVPLSETEFARDLLSPVRGSRVDRIVANQTRRPVFTVEPGILPAEALGIAVYDAVSDADLAAIAESYRNSGVTVYAGCAGFAQYLPRLVQLPKRPVKPVGSVRKLLVVSGSRSSVSRHQVARAAAQGVPVMELPLQLVREPEGAALARFPAEAVRLAREHDALVVCAPADPLGEGVPESRCATADGAPPGDAGVSAEGVARSLAAVARHVLVEADVDGLAVFGGDTLRRVMDDLGVGALEPVEEITPGVVLSRPLGAERPACLVSKAGAFGTVDVVERIRRFLCKGRNT